MTDADDILLNAIEAAESQSYGLDNDELSSDRAKAIDYYLGRPMGNEVEGRSHVVSRDVADTIEWVMPSLLRIFTSGDEVVRFDPVGPEDEEQAQQESDYINHLLTQKNNWFTTCYTWMKDALLTKNAYCMAYWDEKRDTTTERYHGLTDDQFALLMQDQAVELVAHSESQGVGPMGEPVNVHEAHVKRTKYGGCVQLRVLPPERCLVSYDTPDASLREASFFEYWDQRSISDLREMGFEVPDDITEDAGNIDTSEDDARDRFGELQTLKQHDGAYDPAQRKVRARMCWIKHDYDGDGLSEYRQVVAVGRTILSNEDVSCIPVSCIVPVPMPHRHAGLSVYDQVKDLQDIKTAMLRQVVDNTYLQNNGRHAISDKVNLDDMLTSRPGGIVRVQGSPMAEIMPLQHPFVAQQAISVIEYIDQVRQNRTGTNQYFTGVDQNALNKTASGIAQLTSSAAQRVELIARVIAEGVKDLFLIVHELTLKHSRQTEIVRLRGKWAPVDPRQWTKRADMTLAVGLGTGNREQLASGLMNILMAQKEALPIGVATPRNIYNALSELTKGYGFATPEKFWTEPPEGPLPPPPPDPRIEIEKEKIGLERDKGMAEFALGKEKLDIERKKIGVDAGAKLAEVEVAREKMARSEQLEAAKLMDSRDGRNEQRSHEAQLAFGAQDGNATTPVARLESAMQQLAEMMAQIAQSQGAVLQGLERVAQIAASDRESEVMRDPRTGRVAGGRSRLVMPGTVQ